MVKQQRQPDTCRICGKFEVLTEEHILPRAAGGNRLAKMYSGTEMLKTLKVDSDSKPYGMIRQNGHTEFTLCASCNNHSGHVYDKDFADFYNVFCRQIVDVGIANNVPDSRALAEFLLDKPIVVTVDGAKPMNVAKRLLVAFCSVEFEGLAEDNQEIRKAIMDKNYVPDTSGFSLYMTPHVGDESYHATMAHIFQAKDGSFKSEAFAGIETGFLSFFLAAHDEHKIGGKLKDCIDITNWLTDCSYDQRATIEIHGSFKKPLMINFPSPE